jgi:class 3 adenylate cyclase
MEPRIQYAKTKDGVSIAFWTLGEGPPLVFMPFWFSHVQLGWEIPELRRFYERLSEGRTFVTYDGRGMGLSDRDVSDFSVEACILDLEAVVDRLGLERFGLFGVGRTAPAAIVYAVHHPERVTHLVLGSAIARSSDFTGSRPSEAVRALRESDWELFTETMAHYLFQWSEAKQAERWMVYMKESITQEAEQAFSRGLENFDFSDALPQVRAPTLVIHPRHTPFFTVDAARHIASQVPNARLVLVEGRALGMETVNFEAVTRAIDEFLSEGEEAAAATTPLAKEDVHTILFTDVEGSTALTQRLGDAKARDLLREHERIVREALRSHGGSELKTTGDGFMASFSSATRALECAIAMQRAFAEHNESAAEPIRVRVGMNAGEPIAEDEDLFGTAVIEAARIAAAAKGGEILVSDVVRQLAKGKDFLFADRGDVTLKGFDEPVRLYEVRWRD